MPEQTLHNSAMPQKESFWEGRRGRSNKGTLLFSGSALALIVALQFVDIQPKPDDLVHGAFLQDNFFETIEMAIGSPNLRHYVLPDHLAEAGDLYAQHLEIQSSIQETHSDGNRNAEVAVADVANSQALTDARAVFRQGADGSGSGEVVVSAIRCDTTAGENVYDCKMTRAEIGGFDDVNGGLEACQRITDNFTVKANIDGSIEYLRTTGPGFSTAINVDLERLQDEGITDRLTRHFAAYVTGDFVYFGAQENPQERVAFMSFSGCLEGGPRQ